MARKATSKRTTRKGKSSKRGGSSEAFTKLITGLPELVGKVGKFAAAPWRALSSGVNYVKGKNDKAKQFLGMGRSGGSMQSTIRRVEAVPYPSRPIPMITLPFVPSLDVPSKRYPWR